MNDYNYTHGSDPNEVFYRVDGVGTMPVDPRAWPMNANIQTELHQLFLISKNPLIYPGEYTISGTWAAGDEAICAVRFGNTSIGFSHVVQAGETAKQIAEGLRNQMLADSTFNSTPIFVMTVGERASGHFAWHICPPWSTWNTEPRISLSSGKTSVNGKCEVTLQPVNILDTPACTLRLGHTVPGRPAQHEDLIGELAFEGQTDRINSASDENIRQIYGRLQVYVANPSNANPAGRWQFQRASANANNVTNMLMLGQGMWLCDANGNNPSGDPGAGNINLPANGGIYRNGVKIL
jgi:hypothetical protein